jgi:hypothetical protein
MASMHSNLRIAFALLLFASLAGPLAAQAPSAPADLLAGEGVDLVLPDGFPAFEQVADPGGGKARFYRSRAGSRTIIVAILPPFPGQAARDMRLELLMRGVASDSAAADIIREDSVHLIREFRRTDADGHRLVGRIYVPRAGAPGVIQILVSDAGSGPDPATDPAIRAFLDAARLFPRPNPLVQEGIEAEPLAGFTGFELELGDSAIAFRGYISRSDTRVITVTVWEPDFSWSEGGGPERRRIMEQLTNRSTDSITSAVRIREDSTHVIGDYEVVRAGKRGIERMYIPRTGTPKIVAIAVLDDATDFEPGTDPHVMAFLDAARPRANVRRQVPITFRGHGLEIVLPSGVKPPLLRPELNQFPDTQYLMSGSRNHLLVVAILDNPESGSSHWPAERRLRHLERRLTFLVLDNASRIEQEAHTMGDLAFRDLRVDHVFRQRGAGRGRVYTTLSGPHRLISVTYLEFGSSQLSDEAAIEAMLDSVRVLAQP